MLEEHFRKTMKIKKLHGEELHGKKGIYIRSSIFGWQDGLVSAMALLAALTGAATGTSVIILATLAEIVAGAISMGLGTYIGTKSEREVFAAEVEQEKREIEEEPEKEAAEVRDFYAKKGFTKKEIEMIVKRLQKSKAAMLDVMIKEELGGDGGSKEDPKISSIYMFVFYAIGGLIPLLSYFFLAPSAALYYSIALTAVALFGIGAAKSYLTGINPIKSGVEILVIGMIATFAAYQVGIILGGYF